MIELSQALVIASKVVQQLAPECDIINIAGSCRREKPVVKDIEIVCLPKTVVGTDLFGGELPAVRPLAWNAVIADLGGDTNKGKPTGKYMQIALVEGINLDLFMPDDFDYYRQYAIRTGSADWVSRFIAGGWVKEGWVGSDQGLRMKSQCHGERGPDHKMHWKCVVAKNQQMLPPHWKSEEEFFDWLKLKFIHPTKREING